MFIFLNLQSKVQDRPDMPFGFATPVPIVKKYAHRRRFFALDMTQMVAAHNRDCVWKAAFCIL
ncbi:hypothetical protein DPM35_15650 [Mesorhizobium atlanticum]|uniref:Uncharacterized protein n=1 Tax=Mesorhizobium atlanticum TaxID=2233532 RepID=A0A330H0U5_9HYPH|nr:hypothetical protein DPM35_15650 [Mesorhizobium atlanticum]